MRIPKYLLLTMWLLLITVIAGVACWWCTWPDRTAHRFISLVANREFRPLQPLLALNPVDVRDSIAALYRRDRLLGKDENWCRRSLITNLRNEPRTLRDLFAGRREFSLEEIGYVFTIEKGKLVRDEIAGGWGIAIVNEDQQPEQYWLDSESASDPTSNGH